MAKLGDSDIPSIVHITCTSPVADFVQRFMDEYQTEGLPPSWQVLKKLITKLFCEITDESEAMAVLRSHILRWIISRLSQNEGHES